MKDTRETSPVFLRLFLFVRRRGKEQTRGDSEKQTFLTMMKEDPLGSRRNITISAISLDDLPSMKRGQCYLDNFPSHMCKKFKNQDKPNIF